MEENKILKELETERREYNETLKLLVNIQKDYTRSNRVKDWIIGFLITLLFLEAVAGYAGFIWYESQFETKTVETTEVYTEGDNANAEYNENNITGDQYNDTTINIPSKNEERSE